MERGICPIAESTMTKLHISCWIQWWKNGENRQTFGKVPNGKYRCFLLTVYRPISIYLYQLTQLLKMWPSCFFIVFFSLVLLSSDSVLINIVTHAAECKILPCVLAIVTEYLYVLQRTRRHNTRTLPFVNNCLRNFSYRRHGYRLAELIPYRPITTCFFSFST